MNMFSYFRNLFQWSRSRKINVKIITKPLRFDVQAGCYEFQILILPVDRAQGHSDNCHEYVKNACSPEIELVLVSGKCDVSFAVSGALKPLADLEKGEDVIEYNDNLLECSKSLFLKPTYNEDTDGIAPIKFKFNNKIIHTVYIKNVPTERYATPRSLQKKRVSTDAVGSDSSDPEGSSVKENVKFTEGGLYEKEDEAMPMPPRTERSKSHSNVTVLPAESEDDEQNVETDSDQQDLSGSASQQGSDSVEVNPTNLGATGGPSARPLFTTEEENSACRKILSDRSLTILARRLDDGTARRLLIHLQIESAILDQFRTNNPRDSSMAIFESLQFWRNQRCSLTEGENAGYISMYQDLCSQLGQIGRNDLKMVLEEVKSMNRELHRDDFKR